MQNDHFKKIISEFLGNNDPENMDETKELESVKEELAFMIAEDRKEDEEIRSHLKELHKKFESVSGTIKLFKSNAAEAKPLYGLMKAALESKSENPWLVQGDFAIVENDIIAAFLSEEDEKEKKKKKK